MVRRNAAIIACILSAALIPAQAQSHDGTLQGSVRDTLGHAAAGATVLLQNEMQTLTTHTATDGTYRFAAVHAGVYTLHAQMSGFSEATFAPLVVAENEIKKLDLTLVPPKTSAEKASGIPDQPEFFDVPTFTVAGVTDAANPGGHGSAAVQRTTDALAKETVSLSATQPEQVAGNAGVEQSLRDAAERNPASFEANLNWGKFLIEQGKTRDALPVLDKASKLDAPRNGQAELHHLLGDAKEKLGNPLEAVRQYQNAAELDPSETNLFDWGAELLLHRALEPAIEVFSRGNRLYPRSPRMLVGLGVSLYAHGSNDQAVQRLCEASDLEPANPSPYLFLGKIQSVPTAHAELIAGKLRQFAKLYPDNAMANYYYALNLWQQAKTKGATDREYLPQEDLPQEVLPQVQSLLEKAVRLDPDFGSAYLQLGILFSDKNDLRQAISAYQQAIAVSPGLEQAHYRLAQAYRTTGQNLKAQEELRLYNQAAKETADETERERREIQQFVYTLQAGPPAPPQ